MDPVTATDASAVLVTANRAVAYGTVVRWLLHDLRNPTQTLSLVIELLGDATSEPDADLYAALRESTQQLATYVEVLDRTLRTMAHPAPPGPVAVSDVIGVLSRLYLSYKSPTQLDFSPAVAESLPAVIGIEDHLEHALLNLLLNALEAVGDREDGRIMVNATAAHGQVELVIDDNGPGIAPEIRDSLFEPYVTTKPPSAHVTGLGLAVARHLLQLSGGTVAYMSKQEPGARFVVRLRTWPPTQV